MIIGRHVRRPRLVVVAVVAVVAVAVVCFAGLKSAHGYDELTGPQDGDDDDAFVVSLEQEQRTIKMMTTANNMIKTRREGFGHGQAINYLPANRPLREAHELGSSPHITSSHARALGSTHCLYRRPSIRQVRRRRRRRLHVAITVSMMRQFRRD